MPLNTSFILVLGYKNDAFGELLPVAKQRCEKAVQLYHANPIPIVCTGGFGENFNTTPEPHAEHLKRYITGLGVPLEMFGPHVLSRNTNEDGKFTQAALAKIPKTEIHLVTSDFHFQRAFLWMKHFTPKTKVSCHPAKTVVADDELTMLRDHEKQAIKNFYRDFPNAQSVESFPDWHSN